jgi:hypothetical protein
MISTRNLLAVLFVSGLTACVLPGCVERKLTFGSAPSGAIVTLNDEEVGRTPVSVPFTWYGDYDIKLRLAKDVGTDEKPDIRHYYLHTHERAMAPWFQWIGIDLVTELLPIPFKDEKFWAFEVPEVKEPAEKDLIQRARDLKGTLNKPDILQNKKKTTTQPAK